MKKSGIQFKRGYEIKLTASGFNNKCSTYTDYLQMMAKEEYSIKFEFKNSVDTFAYDDLTPGEIFVLTAMLWQFINKNVKANKIKSFNSDVVFLLDVPDRYLDQDAISGFMAIIQKDLVEGLKFRVILTSHFEMLTSYLFDDKNKLTLEKFNRQEQTFYFEKPEFSVFDRVLRFFVYHGFKSLKKREKPAVKDKSPENITIVDPPEEIQKTEESSKKNKKNKNKRQNDKISGDYSSPKKILKI